MEEITAEQPSFASIEDEAAEDEEYAIARFRGRRHKESKQKYQADVDAFLGKIPRTFSTAIVPKYYDHLLAWAPSS